MNPVKDQGPDISVARAVFISALIQSEAGVPDVSREDATLFAKTLLKTCNICTSSNVKLCRSFIIKNIIARSDRIEALMKYLVQLSKSFGPRDLDKRVDTTKPLDGNAGLGRILKGRVQQPPQPAFKRLHILYIIHDVLCYVRSHFEDDTLFADAAMEQLRPKTSTLAELAACRCCEKGVKTTQLVLDLLDFWKTNDVFTPEGLQQMRDNVLLADGSSWTSLVKNLEEDGGNRADEQKQQYMEWKSWRLPDRHGVIDDPTAPWHELPAANGLYLLRTQGFPLRARRLPQGGYEVANAGEKADAQLYKEVTNLHDEMLHCFDKYTNADEVKDIDAVGNIIWKNPERPTRNYWGFTLDGIDKRKKLAREFKEDTDFLHDDRPLRSDTGPRVNDAVERARALATERGREMGRGREMSRGRGMSRGGWRGDRRW